ncbi:hypothetical protein JCM1840_005001 [Sporobolomyces johnsonii]
MAASRTAASTATQALSKASTSLSRPRRLSKRTSQTSRASALSSLVSLYHLTPTFVPTADPASLNSHITATLASQNSSAKPRAHDLYDVVRAQQELDLQRIRLDAAGTSSASASLLGVKLRLSSNAPDSKFELSPSGANGELYDHQGSFFAVHETGAEPPLSQRMRRVVDRLHGTAAGGRAGVEVVEEMGERAIQWKEGLKAAREREREREQREEREAEAFADEFVEKLSEEEASQPGKVEEKLL